MKNKHNLEKDFLEDIGRPKRDKLPRGRPKEKKWTASSADIEKLSIIESSTLKIYELLSKKFKKVILEGNTKEPSSLLDE